MPHEHILVLEDQADLREETRQVLVEAGYVVQLAATCAQANAAASAQRFDVLIAGISLPDGSGIHVLQQMSATQPDVAGILIAGSSSWQVTMQALRVGFVGFLVKPFMPEQLIATVVSALEQEQLRRENARLRALVPLYELSRAFIGTVELPHLLNQIMATVRQETNADDVSLMLADEDCRELHIAAATGLPAEIIENQRSIVGQGIAGRVAARGEPILIADDVPLDPEIRDALLGRPDLLSALSLPLIARGQVIGVLNLTRGHNGKSFTRGDLELATVLASQAAVSIDNARLFHQLRLLSETSQSLARAIDLDEAIAAIVAAPQRLVAAKGAALWLFEDTATPRLAAAQGLEQTSISPPARDNLEEAFLPEVDGSWLVIPLRHGDKTLAALIVRLSSPSRPGDERLGLLRTLAHAAGATLESHRLRARESKAFRELDRAVRADLSLRPLLDRLLEQMIGACEAAGGAIFLGDAEHDRLEAWVRIGAAPPEELAWTVVRDGRVSTLRNGDSTPYAIGAPLHVGGRIQGAAVLIRSTRELGFRARQIDLLSALASSAALFVRNIQLYARSEEAAITEERTRIAREIHDGLAQDLAFMVLKASAAQKLLGRGRDDEAQRELRELTNQLRLDAREVRRVIFALRPLDIEALGFLPALKKFIKEFAQANEVQIEFDVRGDVKRLPPKLETALFRLIQEALNNVRKHAGAQHARVELRCHKKRAVLHIRDDGRGFDVAAALQAARKQGSVGLIQMQERAERAGGSFKIESSPNQGTHIIVELPVREI